MLTGTVVEVREDDPEPFPDLERHLRNGTLVLVHELDPIGRDTQDIGSDWDYITDLFNNMRGYAMEHPEAVFRCADDPGTNTRRVPRWGWVASYLDGDTEVRHEWTITLDRLRASRAQLPINQVRALETANGRQRMLAELVAHARRLLVPAKPEPEPEVSRRTIWERLDDD